MPNVVTPFQTHQIHTRMLEIQLGKPMKKEELIENIRIEHQNVDPYGK